ncbi:ABC transporter permease [Cutibacterium sp.]|uniref:ABC transporter permease n=1 Tax=Cutibacterium sp. TaxID=1912221 RepID=UPI0026DD185D|nr:ABC transporter permease [Cutibacterium sp.]MDO4411881.1 ABC transporter permease [Cutibacterium sp.]
MMLSAFFYRYSRVLLRNPGDTIAMFLRPLLSGVMLLIFAQTINRAHVLPEFMVASVMLSNVITNTVLGAAYESRMDLTDGKRELMELSPGGLHGYSLVQAVTQGGIATVQSLFIAIVLLPLTGATFTPGPVFWVALLLLTLSVISAGALAAKYSALRGAYVGVSFTVGIILTFSGIFYPIETLPQWARTVSFVNPVTYVVGGVRFAFGSLGTSSCLGLAYAGVWTVVAAAAALWRIRR